ncbi:MAG: hypothetical protein GY696_34270 [Gammaproteobacteria bacterium]|nr:hypothetical protein [Gammaproteobacteria bacterium]
MDCAGRELIDVGCRVDRQLSADYSDDGAEESLLLFRWIQTILDHAFNHTCQFIMGDFSVLKRQTVLQPNNNRSLDDAKIGHRLIGFGVVERQRKSLL